MDVDQFDVMARDQRVVVLAGSGISTDQPSGLLTWREFNAALLDALVNSAVGLLPGAETEIRSLNLDDLPIQAFSAIVAGSFSDRHYLPVLDVLEGSTPNRGHHALASLARAGILCAVLTTNFDTLIEQALAMAGVASATMAADYDYAGPQDDRFRIHKLHGSVGRHDTLVDAVHQKLPGLSATRRAIVKDVCLDADVVVLGFSGADFMFDHDYIPLGTARRVIWVIRPGSTVSDRVQEVLGSLAHGIVVESDIVPCLEALGAAPPPTTAPVAPVLVDRRKEVCDRLVGAPNLEWGAAGACLRLAGAGGRDEIVTAIISAIQPRVSAVEKLPFIASSMLRALTAVALRRGESTDAIACATREIAFLDHWIASEEENRNARGLRAGALFNRAQARLANNEIDAGDDDLREALRTSYEAGARELRSPIFNAQAARIAGHDPDLALSLIRAAIETAGGPGSIVQLAAARNLRAVILTNLSEYDSALEAADHLADLHEITGDRAAREHATWHRAVVGFLRGGSPVGLHALLEAVRDAPSSLLEISASNLDRIFSGHLRAPPELVAAFAKRGLVLSAAPPAGHSSPPASAEAVPRERLRRAEFAGDQIQVLVCLRELAGAARLRGVPLRLLDLAIAYRHAAEREDSQTGLTQALNMCAIANDLAGDVRSAAELWAIALSRTPGAFDVEGNLGWALSRLGEVEAALRHLNAAKKQSVIARDAGIEVRVRWYLAEHERRYGDQATSESMLADTIGRAEALGDRAGARVLDHLLQEWRSGQAGEDPDDRASPSDRYRPASPPSEGPRLATQSRELRASDHRQAAESMMMEAYHAYEDANDLRGMSACLNDRAGWRHDDGDTRGAIDLAVEALDLRRRVPDLAGEILTLSNIASWALISAKDHRGLVEAQDSATEAISIGRATEPSRSLLQAWTVLLFVLKAQGADHARIDEATRSGQVVADALGTRHADARAAFDQAVAASPA